MPVGCLQRLELPGPQCLIRYLIIKAGIILLHLIYHMPEVILTTTLPGYRFYTQNNQEKQQQKTHGNNRV